MHSRVHFVLFFLVKHWGILYPNACWNSFGTDCKDLFLIELWDLSHTLKVYYQSQSLQWPRDELATCPGCNFAFTPRLLGLAPAPPPPKIDTQSHMPHKNSISGGQDLVCVLVISRSTTAESQGVMGSLPRGSDSRQLPALHGALPDPQLVWLSVLATETH